MKALAVFGLAAAVAASFPRGTFAAPGCRESAGAHVTAISGKRLATLHGILPSTLRAWAFQGDRRVSVPVQVDSCDAEGRVVVAPPGAHAPENPIGPASVVLLRTADAGDAAPPGTPRGTAVVEIGAPYDGVRAIHLGADADLVRSTVDEVDYEPRADTVRAERYTLRFHPPFVDYFSLADGKGRDRGNLLDRFKARVEATFLWGLVRFRRNEEEVSEEIIGVRDGPLRAVRRARLRVEIGWGLPAAEVVADDYFYGDHAEAPFGISIPFALAYVFGDLDVRMYLDFRDLSSFRMASGEAPSVPLLAAPDSEARAGGKTAWFMLAGEGVSLLHRLRFGPSLATVDCRPFRRDAPEAGDPPETIPGVSPAVGYRLTQWSAVGRGRHEIWMDTFVLDGDADADPAAALARLEAVRPVRVQPDPREAHLVGSR